MGLEGLYEGSWLEEAKQRIEQHRQAKIRVVVTEEGRPVDGGLVRIEMTRHAFPFGAAVTARRLVADGSTDGQRYRQAVTRLFNRVVFENDLKWPAWEGEWGDDFARAQTGEAMDWLQARNISVRGHCLVWPGWKHLPQRLQDSTPTAAELEEHVLDHIRDEAGALQGRIAEWDVVNEAYWNRDLQERLGREAMVRWFHAARSADPTARLFINHARIVSFHGLEPEHKDFYFNEVKYLVEKEAEIDGIGLQCHFREQSLTPPRDAWAMLDRFATFGLPLAVTEFDIHAEDEDVQAKYLHDFLHMAFSHLAVNGITMWGFWEGQIFKRERALYRQDWSAKPAGDMYEALVLDEWWTRESGRTSDTGVFAARGFLGDYRISVTVNGRTRTLERTLGRAGLTVELEWEP